MDAAAGADIIAAATSSAAGRTGGCILGQDTAAVLCTDSSIVICICATRGCER